MTFRFKTFEAIDKKVIGQSLLALTVNVGGILSGRLIVIFAALFTSFPWILVLFPLVLTVRGGTSGILSGKIGTMLHTGEIKPQFRGNTKSFYSLLSSIFTLTFLATLLMGVIAFCFNLLFGQTSLTEILYFIMLPVSTCVLSVLVAIPVTLIVAIKAFQSGLDPDILVYPVMSTINDIIVSLVYILLVSLILPGGGHFFAFLILIFTGSAIFFFVRNFKEVIFTKTLKEGILIVLLSSLFGTFNGFVLTSFRADIEHRPSILILYPALIAALGDIGSIIGSMETTKLALGYITSFWQVLKNSLGDLLSVEAAAFMVHTLFGIGVTIVASLSNMNVDLLFVIQIALVSNVLSFFFIAVFSLFVATQTFKRGLDPDNFVIPLTSSFSDTVSTLTLMSVLNMFRS